MLTLKRLLVIVMGLLCTMCIVACSGMPTTNVQAAPANSTNGTTTSSDIAKETTLSETTKQVNNQTNGQTTNQKSNQTSGNQGSQNQGNVKQGMQSSGQSYGTVNNTKQVSGQMNGSQDNQSNKPNNSTQNKGNQGSNKGNQSSNNSSGTNTLVEVTQVNINGQTVKILATGTGMTLYYDTNDTTSNVTCTGNCAQTWSPFLAQGQIIPSAGINSGQLTARQTANGNQVEYNGHPLYTYVDDGAPGQVNGQGVGSVWYTVSVTTQALHW